MKEQEIAMNSVDNYTNQKYRTVLVAEQTQLNGLTTFGHATNNKAELPLVDHFHKNKFEFVIVVDGVQKYSVDTVEYMLYGGDVFVTQPNEIHSTGTNPQAVNELLWFQLDITKKDNFLGYHGSDCLHILAKLDTFKGRKFQVGRNLIAKFLQAFTLISDLDFIQKLKGQHLFNYSLLCLLDEKPILTTTTPDIEKAKQYILLHLKDPIYMDELVLRSNLSAVHFNRKFKEQIGMTPREFINYTKIEKTKEIVAKGEQNITEIAFDYGFSTSNYFCTVFKQFTGCSPKEYRKKHQKQ